LPDFRIVVLLPVEVMMAVSPGFISSVQAPPMAQTREAPSCSTTVVFPRCDRISRTVPRTPMVATDVVIL
jgi:hypothetical protein